MLNFIKINSFLEIINYFKLKQNIIKINGNIFTKIY